MASDGGLGGPAPRRGAEQGFMWVSSSPSQSEVARLEACFPAVVQIPEAMLEEETSDWMNRAIIARSFTRWVPAEAYIREFRRAGIQGEIVPISLAFRCYIFRFDDPGACDLVLNRPWVVNGQIIGMEAWKPEFFPAADSIATTLIWMRLPNLPMEFWREDILRAISEPAGGFCGSDSATQMKNRGGYARVAVRIDLLRPLRPGTRIQGIQGPFWQQFIYESVEGICPKCGTLHLAGPCSLEEDDAGCSPIFGPWMAAVRQRRAMPKPPQSAASSVPRSPLHGSSSSPAPQSASDVLDQAEGWKTPTKTARRRLPASVPDASASQKQLGETKNDGLVTVPVTVQRAGFKASDRGKLNSSQEAGLKTTPNPFASLGLDPNVGGQVVIRDVGPGPLKRARPVESMPPRLVTSADRKKGKGKKSNLKNKVDLIPSPTSLAEASGCRAADQGSEGPRRVLMGQESDSPSAGRSHRSADIDTVPDTTQTNSSHNPEGSSLSVGSHPDCVMDEVQGGAPSSSS